MSAKARSMIKKALCIGFFVLVFLVVETVTYHSLGGE
jgi:hypothetical protein